MCIYKAQMILPLNIQFSSIHFHAKKLYLHMFDEVDTALGDEEN